MFIGGFQKSSLLDYREKIAAIVFTIGCNFSCPYCHNPELVLNGIQNPPDKESIINFLKTRINKLDGVVITGGEPTLHKNLPDFIKEIKTLGFLVKLDTNGTNPIMLEELIDNKLVDYIAMDIKAPLDVYKDVIRRDINIEDIKKSIQIIINKAPDYEFRTTVVDRLLNYNSFVKINSMFEDLGKIKRYALQKFQKSKHIDESYLFAKSLSDDELEKISALFKNTVSKLEIR